MSLEGPTPGHSHGPQEPAIPEGVEHEVEEVSPVRRRVKVKVSSDLVKAELDTVYKQLKKQAQIKGFRKGKAPRAVLERHYKDRVERDVLQRMIQSSLGPVVAKEQFPLVAKPQVNEGQINEDKSIDFVADLEIRPDFELPAYQDLKIKVPEEEVTDEQVEEQLEALRDRNADLAPVFEERGLAAGDFAVIDYETVVPETGETESKENVTVEVGGDQLIEEFDKGLQGLKPGETRPIELSFPEDHADEKLRGRSVSYQVTLKAIKKKDLPELDDELAKEVGAEDLDDLRTKIREELAQHHAAERKEKVQRAILEEILGKCDFEVPPSVLDRQLQVLHNSAAQVLGERGMNVDQAGADKLKEQLKEEAERRAREVIVLQRIMEEEDIRVTEEDLKEEYQRLADKYQQPAASVAAYHAQSGQQEMLVAQLREAKALDFLESVNKVSK